MCHSMVQREIERGMKTEKRRVTYLQDVAEELGVLVRPVCLTHEDDHLDKFVPHKQWQGGGLWRGQVGGGGGGRGHQVMHKKMSEFHLLCEFQKAPHMCHKVLCACMCVKVGGPHE